jgi:hypothetical protein
MEIRHPAVAITLLVTFGAPVPGKADKIDDYITAQIERLHVPGASLAVVRDGHITKAQGYGFANLELRSPATKETVYEIGSTSKQFTATAIMMLVEEGKVRLDDTITNIFQRRHKRGAASQFGTCSRIHPVFKTMSRSRTGLTFSRPISLLKRPRREMSYSRCFSSCLLSFSQGKRGRTITPAIICLALS